MRKLLRLSYDNLSRTNEFLAANAIILFRQARLLSLWPRILPGQGRAKQFPHASRIHKSFTIF
jgi:hypothetical protein